MGMTPRDAMLHTKWSRDNALEEAAKACEAIAEKVYDHAKGPYLQCAEAIRALKSGVE